MRDVKIKAGGVNDESAPHVKNYRRLTESMRSVPCTLLVCWMGASRPDQTELNSMQEAVG